jgi:hypothetical protein
MIGEVPALKYQHLYRATMSSRFTELAIDCADPGGLARFWCSVLDYEVQDEDDGIVTIGSPVVPEGKNRLGPVPPTLTFARVPEG